MQRMGDPVDFFRRDMVEAAHKGLFSVMIDLERKHQTVGFFQVWDFVCIPIQLLWVLIGVLLEPRDAGLDWTCDG